MAMLLEEFMPLVERQVHTAKRAVLGWSMGGYGAILAAETAPTRFAVVAAASPALWTTAAAAAPGAFDSPTDYLNHDVFARTAALGSLTVRVDCGTDDPFYGATRKFAAKLAAPPQSSFGPGFHDGAYWRSVAPAQIGTIAHAFLSR